MDSSTVIACIKGVNIQPKDLVRFWEKVDRRGVDECWNWQTAPHPATGYGQFHLHGKTVLAHRLSWTIAHGTEPGGIICHKCDNRLCCNPAHHFVGTRADNLYDCIAKGRNYRGEMVHHSVLTEDIVREIRRRTANGEACRELSRSLGFGYSTVWSVIKKKSWKWVA